MKISHGAAIFGACAAIIGGVGPAVDSALSNDSVTCTETGVRLDFRGFNGLHEISWRVVGTDKAGTLAVDGDVSQEVSLPGVSPNELVVVESRWPKWVKKNGKWVIDGEIVSTHTTPARCVEPEQPPTTPPVDDTPPTTTPTAPAPPTSTTPEPTLPPPALCPAMSVNSTISIRRRLYAGQVARATLRVRGRHATNVRAVVTLPRGVKFFGKQRISVAGRKALFRAGKLNTVRNVPLRIRVSPLAPKLVVFRVKAWGRCTDFKHSVKVVQIVPIAGQLFPAVTG